MNWISEVLWAMVAFLIGMIGIAIALLSWAVVAMVVWGVWTFLGSGGLSVLQ